MSRRPLAAALSLLLLPLALGAQVGRTTYAADGEGRLVTGDAAASQEITRVEARIADVESDLADPATLADRERVATRGEEHRALQEELAWLMREWEKAAEAAAG